jgi:type IX secretion system PorP/SprF family membrane protein
MCFCSKEFFLPVTETNIVRHTKNNKIRQMKKSVNQLFVVLFCLVAWNTALGQEAPQYTQYMYHTQSINPAYTGSRGLLGITALYRSQWSGLDGAPTTQVLTIGSPVSRSKQVNLGLSVLNDEIGNGTNRTTDIGIDFAYAIPLNERTSKLAFGLKAGGRLLYTNLNRLRYYDPQNNLSSEGTINQKFAPNVGVGIYYYNQNFYAGLSMPRILQTEFFDLNDATNTYISEERAEYYFMTGGVLNLNSRWKFKPATLIKLTNGSPLKVDLSANFMLDNRYVFGAGYRWGAAVSVLTGFRISKAIFIGLSYDREISELGGIQFNDGSFECFMRFELFNTKKRIVSGRFF